MDCTVVRLRERVHSVRSGLREYQLLKSLYGLACDGGGYAYCLPVC